MIEEELVNLWKREYGAIYVTSYKDVDYAFREITTKEYDEASFIEEEISTADAEDYLVGQALLFPRDKMERIPAGFISILADQIISYSNFFSPKDAKKALEDAREEASQMRVQMKAFVLAAMPSYKEEDLDALTFRQLCGKLALAEEIVKINQVAFGGQPTGLSFDIKDPEEEYARAMAEEKAKRDRQEKAWALIGKQGYIPEQDEKAPPIAPEIKPEDPIAAKLREALGG